MKRKPLAFFLGLLLFLLGAGFLAFFFFLPRYIEKNLLPDLGRQLSEPLAGRVYHLGLTSVDLGEIVLGNTRNPTATIGSIHADYSLPALLAGKLGQVRIAGLTLHLEISGGRLIIPGFDLESLNAPEAENSGPQQAAAVKLPITPENIQVRNGLLSILYEGENFLIPFDLQLGKGTEDFQSVYEVALRMTPRGEEITMTGTIDVAGNRGFMQLVAASLDLDRFGSLTGPGRYDLRLGKASIKGRAEISLLPLQLAAASLDIDPELVQFRGIPLRFGRETPDAGPAISLELKRQDAQLLISAQGSMQEPLEAALEMQGSAMPGDNSLQSSGNIILRLPGSPAKERDTQPPVSLAGVQDLQGDFTLDLDKSGSWQAEFTSPGQKQQGDQARGVKVHYDKIRLQAGLPSLTVQGQGGPAALDVQLSLALPLVQALYDGAEISIPATSLQAQYRQEKAVDGGRKPSVSFSLTLDRTKFQKNGLGGKADIFLEGATKPQVSGGNSLLQAEGRIRLVNAEITERGSSVAVGGIAGNIPWAWPQTGKAMAGTVKVSRMQWKDVDLGSFKGDITFKDMLYSLEGKYTSSLFKGIVTKVSGRAGVAGSAFFGELALQTGMTSFVPINLGKFDRGLDKSYFSGELGIDTVLTFGESGLRGKMQVNLHNGTFENPEKKYTVKGIDLSMLVPELPNLRTAPAQTLNFAEASIGNLAFSNGKLVWQLEAMDSFFLEEGVVQWAGGRVFTNAVRISPARKEFLIPIFCDRLMFTEILRQFGVSEAEGEGTVNGRIPLRVGKNTISFEDGFLYSSPGQGGSVKVAAFDLLEAGIPKNSPQFAQVDFAAEALKNFQYNWVKLLMNSEGEDLVMQMQMDGKPMQSLPFTYDSQTGLLQRADGTKEGINQPIRIDVNFRLPLNRFLGYSGKIQDIMQKIK